MCEFTSAELETPRKAIASIIRKKGEGTGNILQKTNHAPLYDDISSWYP